jgi:FkbM family methyltransferase
VSEVSYPRLPYLILPLTRIEFPGWSHLFRLLRVSVPPGSKVWGEGPVHVIRGKSHGFLMELHLHDWAERMTYFLGRYYDLPLDTLLKTVLRAGDRVVDVGGNIGMITLLAAKGVGKTGLVQTFEPNPNCQNRLRGTLALNHIDWVTVHPLGLSNEATTQDLKVANDHSGVGTFVSIPNEHQDAITSTMSLQLVRGDDVLLEDPRPIKLIKIDIEGYEVKALQGLSGTLDRDRPLVVLETLDGQLRLAGSSADELFDLMQSKGYRAYTMALSRRLMKYSLKLTPVKRPSEIGSATDTLWVHPAGPAVEELLRPFVAAPAG